MKRFTDVITGIALGGCLYLFLMVVWCWAFGLEVAYE